jgi:hypothetical protein
LPLAVRCKSDADGRAWRAEKEIEHGRGEARAQESIGATDSKHVSLGKNGQREIPSLEKIKKNEMERLLDCLSAPQ